MTETRPDVPQVNKQMIGSGLAVVLLSAMAIGWFLHEGDTVTGLSMFALVVSGLLYVGIGISPSETAS